MSEEPKGVTVTTGGEPDRQTHPEAKHVEVRDGHLFVKRGENQGAPTVAIYAPGVWQTAVVGR